LLETPRGIVSRKPGLSQRPLTSTLASPRTNARCSSARAAPRPFLRSGHYCSISCFHRARPAGALPHRSSSTTSPPELVPPLLLHHLRRPASWDCPHRAGSRGDEASPAAVPGGDEARDPPMNQLPPLNRPSPPPNRPPPPPNRPPPLMGM
jgi:hypothetical protein